MTIEKIKRFPQDPVPQPKTPRCEADVSDFSEHERRWREKRYPASAETRPFQCSRDSVVRIQGKHYCRLHGGHKALDMVLSGELVEKET